MTINGSLQVSIPIVKAFLREIFKVTSKIGEKFAFWGEMWSECKIFFLGPQKAHPCAKRRHFDVFIAKIGVGVLAVGAGKNKKASRIT